MLKAGITGGIGSGKSTVCQVFETLGIPVFYADEAAKSLMNKDADLKEQIKLLFGNAAYENDRLNTTVISKIAFTEKEKLQRLNALVHPAVLAYGEKWMNAQSAPYCLKEAAIFFESGSNKAMDIMIGVKAPEELRIRRVMKRGNLSREAVQARIAQQMNEEEKMALCDYILLNDDQTSLIEQVLQLHEILLSKQK